MKQRIFATGKRTKSMCICGEKYDAGKWKSLNKVTCPSINFLHPRLEKSYSPAQFLKLRCVRRWEKIVNATSAYLEYPRLKCEIFFESVVFRYLVPWIGLSAYTCRCNSIIIIAPVIIKVIYRENIPKKWFYRPFFVSFIYIAIKLKCLR